MVWYTRIVGMCTYLGDLAENTIFPSLMRFLFCALLRKFKTLLLESGKQNVKDAAS